MIKIEHDFSGLLRKFGDIEKRQIPFALSQGINKTANRVKEAEIKEMKDVFDRPTPYTLSSIFVKPSNKRSLTAVVGLKDTAAKAIPVIKFLTPQIIGGVRRLKRYEVALRSAGVLPSNYFTVPGKAAKMDAFGNMSRGQIVQILSYFEAFPESGFRSNATEKTRERLRKNTKKKIHGISYFSVQPGDQSYLEPGIWMRVHHQGRAFAVRPVLIFVERTLYDPIFDFAFVAKRVNEKYFGEEFSKALEYAMKTAK